MARLVLSVLEQLTDVFRESLVAAYATVRENEVLSNLLLNRRVQNCHDASLVVHLETDALLKAAPAKDYPDFSQLCVE